MKQQYTILGLLAVICICILPVSGFNVTTGAVNLNTSTNCAIFNGDYDGAVPAHVWFEYGMNQTETNGYKSYKTPNQTKTTTGNFSFKQCGIPLLYRETYVVQAVAEYVYGDNQSFTMPSPTPHVTMTYDVQVQNFIGSNEYGNDGFDPMKLLTYSVWQPYIGIMGGLFFGVVIGFIFLNIAIKQKTVSLTTILFVLIGISIMTLLPPAFGQLAQILVIAAICGALYWWIIKRR